MSVEQTWVPSLYERNARFVADLGTGLLEWLGPHSGERVLDLGCGDGALTVKIRDAGADVVGADANEALVVGARALGLDAGIVNCEAHSFECEFDVVFSNAALHWMRNAEAVVEGVRRSLRSNGRVVAERSNGRVVAEFGGKGNVAAIVTALLAVGARNGIDPRHAMPWYFPTDAEYGALLHRHGFAVDRIALIPRPTLLPGAIADWLLTFRQPFFAAAGERRDEVLAEVADLLAPSLRDDEGNWTADYVCLRIAARLL